MTSRDEDAPRTTDADGPTEAPTARELLRHALVNEDDPRFPWWLPVPGIILALLWAGWRTASASAGPDAGSVASLDVFLQTLLWPGAGIFLLTSAATWAGWQLEID